MLKFMYGLLLYVAMFLWPSIEAVKVMLKETTPEVSEVLMKKPADTEMLSL